VSRRFLAVVVVLVAIGIPTAWFVLALPHGVCGSGSVRVQLEGGGATGVPLNDSQVGAQPLLKGLLDAYYNNSSDPRFNHSAPRQVTYWSDDSEAVALEQYLHSLGVERAFSYRGEGFAIYVQRIVC